MVLTDSYQHLLNSHFKDGVVFPSIVTIEYFHQIHNNGNYMNDERSIFIFERFDGIFLVIILESFRCCVFYMSITLLASAFSMISFVVSCI